jgi:hypothetical protein
LPDRDLEALDVQILDAQRQCLEQAEPAAVEQRGDETRGAIEAREQVTDFGPRQDDRQAGWGPGSDDDGPRSAGWRSWWWAMKRRVQWQ